MRKFVDKNKKKRKYIKHLSGASSFSLPDLVFIGLFPPILIALTYILTSLHQPADIHIYYNPPAFSSNPLEFLTPFGKILQDLFAYVLQTVTAGLTGARDIADSISGTASSTGTASLTTFEAFRQTVLAIIGSIAGLLETTAQQFTSFFDNLFSIISHAISAALDAIVGFLSSLFKSIALLLQRMLLFFETVAQGIRLLIDTTVANVAAALTVITDMIKLPFITIGKYLKEFQPILTFLQNSFVTALEGLRVGFVDLMNITREIARASA